MTEDEIASLAEFIAEPPPPGPVHAPEPKPWKPYLNPTQELIFNDPTPNILADGEKGSGKSYGCLHKIVRHCYEAGDPRKLEPITGLCVVIVRAYNTGDIGIWYELENLVLPTWRDGNREPEWIEKDGHWVRNERVGELLDDGIGLEYTPTKLDPKTKASKIYIQNRHGSWSLVVLVSIPHAVMIEARMKGISPSFVYVEEITDTENRKYYSYPAAQLSRRKGVGRTPCQFLASCNPSGPSHWVYKLWWDEKHVEDEAKHDKRFARHHVPVTENIRWIGEEYCARLLDAFGNDPVDRARFIDGIWVDRPSGVALFRDYYVPAVHVKPPPGTREARNGAGLIPHVEFPLTLGFDPGPVNFSVHFLQSVPTESGVTWIIFDELNYVGQYMPYFRIVPAIMRRLVWWNKICKTNFIHEDVADEAAFNQIRSDGKYDYIEIERLSREWCEDHPDVQVTRIKLKPAPKGSDSVPARVRCVIALLQQEQLLVSARCLKTQEMFAMLESEPQKDGKYDPLVGFRPARSIFVHPFDSISYPIFRYTTQGRWMPRQGKPSEVYACG